MLQAIRSKAESYVVKVLFAILAATFALWGIGDIFRNWGVNTSVATVGSQAISADQVSQEVHAEMDQLRNVLGDTIDADKAKQLGLLDAALERIVNSNLVDLETQRLGLVVGDEAVRRAILNDPNFKDPKGNFDRTRYDQILAANQMTDAQFEASIRQDIIRSQLTGAVVSGMSAPAPMVDALYRLRAERRIADVATLTPAASPAAPTPNDAQLAAFYNGHKEAFRVPAQRSLTIALLTLNNVAATIPIAEDKLKQQYAASANEFQTPEERDIKQMLLPSEAKAKEAKAKLDAGQDFAAVAKSEANADAASTDLGWVKRSDLPGELAQVAFSLPKGKASEPVKTSFGWHILLVTGIKPPQTQSFDAVKEQLKREMQRDQAGDVIANLANNIDDAMAGGASFAAVVQKFGMKTQTIASVDAQGRGPDGTPVELPQPAKTILQTAFATDAGQTSSLTDLGEDGYFIVHVDKVTPSEVKPLAEARSKAVTLWQADYRKNALEKMAASIVQEVDSGKSLKDVAASRKLAVATTPPLERTGGDSATPPALVAALFDAKQGKAVSAPAGSNIVIAQLTSIEPADPAKDAAGVKQLSDALDAALQNDMLGAFEQSLRANFPVRINQTNLDRVL